MRKFISGHLLIVLVLFSVLLAGCQKEEVAVVTETVPVTTTETTAAAKTDPSGLLDELSLTLSPNVTRDRISDSRENLVRDGEIVGGIVVMDLDEGSVLNTEKLVEYLETNIVEGLTPADYDYYMGGSSWYALIEMECGNQYRWFTHYIYQGNSAFYDLWFEDTLVNGGEVQLAIASLQSEDIPHGRSFVFSLDQVTEISFNLQPLPDLNGLQELWEAVQADLAAGTMVPDAGRHDALFHYASGTNVFGEPGPHDTSYISLGLSADTDSLGFQIYPECENTMAWMVERNILEELGAEVVERSREISFEVVEVDATHLTLRGTRTSGHGCQQEFGHCTMAEGIALENPYLYITEELRLGTEGTAEVTIDWTDRLGPLPAGDYTLNFFLRNSPPDTNDWQECSVAFTIPESFSGGSE